MFNAACYSKAVLYLQLTKTYNEYSEAAGFYRENNPDEINVCQRNVHRRNVEISRLHNENEYLGGTLSDDIPLYRLVHSVKNE